MKKLIALVLVLMMVLSFASALAEVRTKVPAGQIEGAPPVYFVINAAYFKADSDIIVIGQKANEYYKRYDQPVAITQADDDLLVPLDSLSKIFQFTYTYDAATGAIHLEDEYVKAELAVGSKDVTIDGVADTLAAAPAEVEGVLCVPAVSVGTKVFALVTGESLGYTYLAYEDAPLPKGATGLSGVITPIVVPDKVYGVIEPVYWFEEAQMLMPYRLFVPTSYDPEVPTPLVIYLHGGSGNDNRDIERTRNYNGTTGTWWDYELDAFGFIGLSVNGYDQARYGGDDSQDPIMKQATHLCEMEVLSAIAEVKAKYNIDESRVFLMGNSMGGGGTCYLVTAHPDMFAACSPSGAFHFDRDFSVFGGKPVRVVMGTEDPGYNEALEAYKQYKDLGINITFRGVAGAAHNTAWSQDEVLTQTFEFFANAVK